MYALPYISINYFKVPLNSRHFHNNKRTISIVPKLNFTPHRVIEGGEKNEPQKTKQTHSHIKTEAEL